MYIHLENFEKIPDFGQKVFLHRAENFESISPQVGLPPPQISLQSTTNLSTLKEYNFDVENSVEFFMLKIEENLGIESSFKWEDKTAELKKENEMVTIEIFVNFFPEKVRKGEM